ncbi:MAG TPA: lipase maturation factor family protein [Candidatus Limnocylindrales bacterium]|nr:lipase maturation factor family protein [Candidatus Limnocylindrales bacterium]
MNGPRPRAAAARLLLRSIALVYLIAFVSLAVQIKGLYGARGILPAAQYLDYLSQRLGPDAWQAHPTVFWLGASDAMLTGVCWAGAASALLLMMGVLPTITALLCWLLYFSLYQIGRVFLGFQWDILLLETGFLAIFLAPMRLRQQAGYDPEPSPVVIWMFRWLVFRLMFASGAVKLLSNDPVWWNLTALEYHYWTQPLPTWTAWLANQLPAVLQRFSCAMMFGVELGASWLALGPRRARLAGFFLLVGLQFLIAATGNYTFFNLLSASLCLSLLDDDAIDAMLDRVQPKRLVAGRWPREPVVRSHAAMLRTAVLAIVALPLAVCGGALMIARFRGFDVLPPPVLKLVAVLEPWHVTSSYGLFSVMTKHRPEVILEGSEDGQQWVEYPFRWKPVDVARRPRFVAPHQPRLDWQMWFAALDDWRRSPWLVELERRLLEGSPDVIALLASDPFHGKPPHHVRAMLYEYEFTDWTAHRETGAWWKRRPVGQFSPTLSRP